MLLTYQQVAERLTISVRQVRRLIAEKRLRCVVFGHRTRRVKSADVELFVQYQA